MTLTALFDEALRREASDLHLATGESPRLRIGGELVPLEAEPDLPSILQPLLTPEAWARLGAGLSVERTLPHRDSAFVALVFRVGDAGLGATFRRLPADIPPLSAIAEDVGPLFRSLAESRTGLVVIAGSVGSGKWTTAASLVDAINAERAARIFVVAGRPSFLFRSQRSMVTALHVGQDVESHERALATIEDADADVVLLDDLPTVECLRRAVVLAETGRLVIANLSVETSVEAVERLIESAGDESPALRRALADRLLAATGQRLLSRVGGGRVPLYEWIVSTPRVREALLGGGLAQAQEEDAECRSPAKAARELLARGALSPGDAQVFDAPARA